MVHGLCILFILIFQNEILLLLGVSNSNEENDVRNSPMGTFDNETPSHPVANNEEPIDRLPYHSRVNTPSDIEPTLNCVEYVCRGKVNIKLNDIKPPYFKESRKESLRRIVRKGRKAIQRFSRFVNNYSRCR